MYFLTSRPSLFPPFNVVGGAAGLAEKSSSPARRLKICQQSEYIPNHHVKIWVSIVFRNEHNFKKTWKNNKAK
jgi:hypothetical protein